MPHVTLTELRARDPRLDRRLATRDPSPADTATMIRTGLIASGQVELDLAGTPIEGWDHSVWANHGLVRHGTILRLMRWRPAWLDHGHINSPDDAPSRRTVRRHDDDVPADPFYKQTMHRPSAKTFAQRDALRAAAIAGPCDTVVCVLPTGSGKTDVVLTRALRKRPRQALVVVPTVSLAIDLERRAQWQTRDERTPLAYIGSGNSEDKERIRVGIATGSQWLTIAAPEAVCTALASPLREAAERGTLDLIAVDEAHIVAGWGDTFRPAFQSLAGLRQSLLDIAPEGLQPTTVLLTGTLDTYGLSTLTRLFPGRRQLLVSGQATRPEPAWWSAPCADEDDKRQKLIEALRHLPRPALVYTTLRISERSTNTTAVASWLSAAGFRAVTEIAGNPKPSIRQAAVRGLRLEGTPDEDLDIVVATSAFGLGIDIPDIRTVIHVCVPESVDRLYQEVGRSGRDGCATAAITLWTPTDVQIAAQMASERLVGPDMAWRRWQSMRRGAWSGDELRVDLRADHAGVKYPISDANIYWNVQTLAAMERAGMLRRRWPAPLHVPRDANDDDMEAHFERQRTAATVEVLQSDISDMATFQSRFAEGQRTARQAADAALTAATELARGIDKCTNHDLALRYQLEDQDGNQFPVSVACGGCPHCRRTGRVPYIAPGRGALTAGELRTDALDELSSLAADGRLCVRVDEPDRRALRALFDRLVRRGVIILVTADPDAATWDSRAVSPWWTEDLHQWTSQHTPWRVPTLLVADSTIDDAVLTRALSRLARQPLGIVLTPATRHDPANPKQLLHESWTPSYGIEDLLRRI